MISNSKAPALSTPAAIAVLVRSHIFHGAWSWSYPSALPPPNPPTNQRSTQVAYTLIYVVPFYLSSTTRPSPTLARDAPSVIRARIRSVTVSCIVCSITSFVALAAVGEDARLSRSWNALHYLGYMPVGFAETINCLLLTATLFIGPLFEAGIVEGRWRDWIRLRDVDMLSSWPGWRNLVAVRPTLYLLSRSL